MQNKVIPPSATPSAAPPEGPQQDGIKRWTTHQIFTLFAPGDNDEWVKALDLAALSASRTDPAGPTPSASLEQRWNEFLRNGGFFNPGMTADCNEDALRQLALDTRDFLAALRQAPAETPPLG